MHGIFGHQEEKNLSTFVTSKNNYFAFGTSNGYIHVMGQDSKQLLFDLKMNGKCNAIAFSPCEQYLFSVGDQAEIYQWDLSTRRCLSKTDDDGAYHTTTIAVSPNGNLIATGSKMGTVNMFQVDSASSVLEAKPFKTMGQLTTSITDL